MSNEMRNAIKGNDHLDLQKVAVAGDAKIASADAAVLANTALIEALEALLGGYKIVSCSIEDAADAAASTEVTLTGALATDVAIAIAADLSNGSATFLQSAVAGVDKVTVTFDAVTASGDKFNLLVLRPAS